MEKKLLLRNAFPIDLRKPRHPWNYRVIKKSKSTQVYCYLRLERNTDLLYCISYLGRCGHIPLFTRAIIVELVTFHSLPVGCTTRRLAHRIALLQFPVLLSVDCFQSESNPIVSIIHLVSDVVVDDVLVASGR